MNHINSLSGPEIEFVIAVLLTLFCYTLYYFTAFSEKAAEALFRLFRIKHGAVEQFGFQKLTGFVFMGLLPILVILICLGSPLPYGLSGSISIETFFWVIGLTAIIIPINFFIAGKPENLKQYPQIRIDSWNRNTFLVNFTGWTLYLLAYEFLFRGVLFTGSLSILGFIPALVLNVIIYALAHLPKGAKETFGAIPVGIIICAITYQTGNIWASFLIHLTMALSNEVFAFYRHPEMYYKKRIH